MPEEILQEEAAPLSLEESLGFVRGLAYDDTGNLSESFFDYMMSEEAEKLGYTDAESAGLFGEFGRGFVRGAYGAVNAVSEFYGFDDLRATTQYLLETNRQLNPNDRKGFMSYIANVGGAAIGQNVGNITTSLAVGAATGNPLAVSVAMAANTYALEYSGTLKEIQKFGAGTMSKNGQLLLAATTTFAKSVVEVALGAEKLVAGAFAKPIGAQMFAKIVGESIVGETSDEIVQKMLDDFAQSIAGRRDSSTIAEYGKIAFEAAVGGAFLSLWPASAQYVESALIQGAMDGKRTKESDEAALSTKTDTDETIFVGGSLEAASEQTTLAFDQFEQSLAAGFGDENAKALRGTIEHAAYKMASMTEGFTPIDYISGAPGTPLNLKVLFVDEMIGQIRERGGQQGVDTFFDKMRGKLFSNPQEAMRMLYDEYGLRDMVFDAMDQESARRLRAFLKSNPNPKFERDEQGRVIDEAEAHFLQDLDNHITNLMLGDIQALEAQIQGAEGQGAVERETKAVTQTIRERVAAQASLTGVEISPIVIRDAQGEVTQTFSQVPVSAEMRQEMYNRGFETDTYRMRMRDDGTVLVEAKETDDPNMNPYIAMAAESVKEELARFRSEEVSKQEVRDRFAQAQEFARKQREAQEQRVRIAAIVGSNLEAETPAFFDVFRQEMEEMTGALLAGPEQVRKFKEKYGIDEEVEIVDDEGKVDSQQLVQVLDNFRRNLEAVEAQRQEGLPEEGPQEAQGYVEPKMVARNYEGGFFMPDIGQYIATSEGSLMAFYSTANPGVVLHEWMHHVLHRGLMPSKMVKSLAIAYNNGEDRWTRENIEKAVDGFLGFIQTGTFRDEANVANNTLGQALRYLHGVFGIAYENALKTIEADAATHTSTLEIPPEAHEVYKELLSGPRTGTIKEAGRAVTMAMEMQHDFVGPRQQGFSMLSSYSKFVGKHGPESHIGVVFPDGHAETMATGPEKTIAHVTAFGLAAARADRFSVHGDVLVWLEGVPDVEVQGIAENAIDRSGLRTFRHIAWGDIVDGVGFSMTDPVANFRFDRYKEGVQTAVNKIVRATAKTEGWSREKLDSVDNSIAFALSHMTILATDAEFEAGVLQIEEYIPNIRRMPAINTLNQMRAENAGFSMTGDTFDDNEETRERARERIHRLGFGNDLMGNDEKERAKLSLSELATIEVKAQMLATVRRRHQPKTPRDLPNDEYTKLLKENKAKGKAEVKRLAEETIGKELKHLTIEDINELLKSEAQKLAEPLVEHLEGVLEKEGPKDVPERAGDNPFVYNAARIFNTITSRLEASFLNPATLLQILDGKTNGVLSNFFLKRIDAANNDYARLHAKDVERFKELIKENNVQSLDLHKKTPMGDKQTVIRDFQALKIYLVSRNQDQLNAYLADEPFLKDDPTILRDAIKHVEADDTLKGLAKSIQQMYDEKHTILADAFMDDTGKLLGKVLGYSPQRRADGTWADADPMKAFFPTQEERKRGLDWMVKSRKDKAEGTLRLTNPVDELMDYLLGVDNYIAKRGVIGELQDVLNAMKPTFEQVYGKDARVFHALSEMLKREHYYSGRVHVMSESEMMVQEMRRRGMQSILAFRIPTMAVQTLSHFNGLAYIGGGIKAVSRHIANSRSIWQHMANNLKNMARTKDFSIDNLLKGHRVYELMLAHDPAQLKPHADPDLESRAVGIMRELRIKGVSLADFGLSGIQLADMWTRASVWLTAYDTAYEQETENMEMDVEEISTSAGEFAKGVVRKTQPPAYVHERALIQTENEFTKTFMTFTGFTMTAFQAHMSDVVIPLVKAIQSKSLKNVGEVLFRPQMKYGTNAFQKMMLASVVPALAYGIIKRGLRPPDKEEFWMDILTYPINLIPIIGPQVASAIAFKTKRIEYSPLAFQWMTKVRDLAGDISAGKIGDETYESLTDLFGLGTGFSQPMLDAIRETALNIRDDEQDKLNWAFDALGTTETYRRQKE